jgi:hypothetical protein
MKPRPAREDSRPHSGLSRRTNWIAFAEFSFLTEKLPGFLTEKLTTFQGHRGRLSSIPETPLRAILRREIITVRERNRLDAAGSTWYY